MNEVRIDIDKPITVLVVHASVGSGHKSAANAVASALSKIAREGDQAANCSVNVKVLDILDFGRVKIDGNAYASSFTGGLRPIYDLTWRYFFTGHLVWGGGTSWSRVMFSKFTQCVRDLKPDAIVCTHITAANAAVGAKLIVGGNFPILCVPTDYEVEGLWPHKYTDVFCVANEPMAETLRARKVDERRIKITGMPASPDFRDTYDRDETLSSFSLPVEKRIALVLAGASLPRPYVNFREVLEHLIPFMHIYDNLHFAIVAGKGPDYKEKLKRLVDTHHLSNVSIFGYVEDMAMLMSAADFTICKPGGLVVTECLASDTPMILTCRAYGQEKANVKLLTAEGAARHVTTTRELFDTLELVNENEQALSGIRRNARLIRRPNASMDIARQTFKMIEEKQDGRYCAKKHLFTLIFGHRPAHPR